MRKGYISTYVKTFIILVIIVLIFLGASYFIRDGYDKEQFETVKTNMLLIEAKTKIVAEKVRIKEKDASYVGKKIENLQEDENIKKLIESEIIKPNEKDVKYYVLEQSYLEELGLTNISPEKGYYIVEYSSNEIIYSEGIKNEKGDTVYKLSEINEKENEVEIEQNVEVNNQKKEK